MELIKDEKTVEQKEKHFEITRLVVERMDAEELIRTYLRVEQQIDIAKQQMEDGQQLLDQLKPSFESAQKVREAEIAEAKAKIAKNGETKQV